MGFVRPGSLVVSSKITKCRSRHIISSCSAIVQAPYGGFVAHHHAVPLYGRARGLTPQSRRQIAASCNLRLTSNVRPRVMLGCITVPLRVFSVRSLQMQCSRSVCGPSVLRRPASLTLSSRRARSWPWLAERAASAQEVQLQLGLSVLRRPARQPRHIEPAANSRASVGVCSAWFGGCVQQNHQMQATPHNFKAQCLRSGSVRRVCGTSSRRAAVRQSPWPNPSVEPTNCGKPQLAAHLER